MNECLCAVADTVKVVGEHTNCMLKADAFLGFWLLFIFGICAGLLWSLKIHNNNK